MATNKHATIRYNTLDRCFRNPRRKYFMDDLIEECCQSLSLQTGITSGVQRRQIYDDIDFMESEAGFDIELNRLKDGRKTYYRYADPNFSIKKQLLNDQEVDQIKEALVTLKRFKGLPQFEWIDEITTRLESSFSLVSDQESAILFDQNIYLKGLNHISSLYYAIINRQVLRISYQSFKQDKPKDYLFSPHLLKQFNNRWFIFGFMDGYTNHTNLSLDRICEVEVAERAIFQESKLNFEELFEDMVGVTIPRDAQVERVFIKVNEGLKPYILSKPIHGSQKVIDHQDFMIELQVYINFELTSQLLSFGKDIEVIEPLHLRHKLTSILKDSLERYL
ncbi:WYL domain-containing protein [Halosquirtibacter laminarini]|uniref:WYL domain-containing protein n=1 Tax=Halosquirtibacter laminarini TaxID=3374600 RepID=A0AC61NIE9_9BACT|nr:WYL domain-containing protein [Prolixibacteraceae bacterium]